MAPTLSKFPPAGPVWIHEVKFDGWWAQLHVDLASPARTLRSGVARFGRLYPKYVAGKRSLTATW
jgi:ATP-dependent DNA ligase